MTLFRFSALFALLLSFQNCGEKTPPPTGPLHAEILPSSAQRVEVAVRSINCWVERGQFFVTGICSNTSAGWQKIWLEAAPLDAAGKPITISKHRSVIIGTFSDAVPPNGRTAFYASWPVTDFSKTPATCSIKAAGATPQAPGPILVVPTINALKIRGLVAPGQPITEEKAWQISSSIHNPLAMVASRPRLEILVFDTEGTLWLSTMLNPEDPATNSIFRFEREGPLQANEERPFNLQVSYERLPQPLKEKKIGRVEILPFEARQ
ncbi:MAG: hypothetical protein ACKVUS_14495 [Saprospiraceae bacterium]